MNINRRKFLYFVGATTGVAIAGTFPGACAAQPNQTQTAQQTGTQQTGEGEPFQLPPLPYAHNALEPHIDAETMQIHHDRHHAAYVRNLNEAIQKHPQLKGRSAEDLIRNLNDVPEDIRTQVRNNGGGHVNHSMFWEIMSPNGGGEPTGAIAQAIQQTFGSFDKFKEEFNQAGSRRFGSGWAWLVRDAEGNLRVTSTPNQDSPLMEGQYPIMGNDVWEHAYYISYRNRRDDYLEAWWNVVNWEEINRRFQAASA